MTVEQMWDRMTGFGVGVSDTDLELCEKMGVGVLIKSLYSLC